MVAGLLFLALAFFAVGQAGASRNGTQSGADAAALAAAQESRDLLGEELTEDTVFDPGFLDDFLGGGAQDTTGAGCDAAARFAEANGTTVVAGTCHPLTDGRWGYTLRVLSQEPVGDTILPGTESEYAEATATAVVEPRCSFEPSDEPLPPGDDGDQDDAPGPSDPDDDPGPPDPEEPDPEEPATGGALHCDGGETIAIDPARPDDLPDMSDLFTVRLDGD